MIVSVACDHLYQIDHVAIGDSLAGALSGAPVSGIEQRPPVRTLSADVTHHVIAPIDMMAEFME